MVVNSALRNRAFPWERDRLVLHHPRRARRAAALQGTRIAKVPTTPVLLYSVPQIYNRTRQFIPLLMAAALSCIAVTVVLSADSSRQTPPCAWLRARCRTPPCKDSTAV
ncbi:hypothetical protein ACIRU3_44270 [Streptomyces sp. NPDC101151]|uniref:hypothetical protein n=1 Tax=Streptomyces sp. NPDC101151 TaxID=3366115 RepID=UPI0038021631